MEDIIISQPRTLDNITIDGEHQYAAYITIGLVKSCHFRIFLEFDVFDEATVKKLYQLYRPVKPVRIQSEVITKENYNISHIIIEQFKTERKCSITWECISDDPDCSLL